MLNWLLGLFHLKSRDDNNIYNRPIVTGLAVTLQMTSYRSHMLKVKLLKLSTLSGINASQIPVC